MVGPLVGAELTTGSLVGFNVVGVEVGRCVGDRVGFLVVGCFVGFLVGFFVGFLVVGRLVGRLVGFLVGFFVGFGVTTGISFSPDCIQEGRIEGLHPFESSTSVGVGVVGIAALSVSSTDPGVGCGVEIITT